MMTKKILLAAALAAAVALLPAWALANVTVVFNNGGNATTTPGSALLFSGTITNNGLAPVSLAASASLMPASQNQPSPGLNGVIIDPATAGYLPTSLNPSQIYQGPLVKLNVSATASPAGYLGVYSLADAASSTAPLLATQYFYPNITASSSAPAAPSNVSASSSPPANFSNFVGLQMPGGASSSLSGGLQIPGGDNTETGQFAGGPRLIKLDGDATVYWVSGANIKIPMFSAKVFLSYGNKWADVAVVGQDEFDFYPDAKFIWLNGAGAIYLIKDGTKSQIPSDIWNNSGMDAGQIINVNKTDFNSYHTGAPVTSADELSM